MRSFIFPVFLSLSVTACSSSSNDSASETESSPAANFRLVTLTVDFDSADVPDALIEYDYDSAGRI